MRLSKKSAHRIIVSLGLIAPIVYLFGSLFFGMNGAHGNQIFAQTPDSQEILVDSFLYRAVNDNGSEYNDSNYRLSSFLPLYNDSPILRVNGSVLSVSVAFYSSDKTFISRPVLQSGLVVDFNSVLSAPSGSSFCKVMFGGANNSSFDLESFTLTFLGLADDVFWVADGMSDYLFGQFFAKDNFLKQWGENVLSDNPVGFAPFATFIKFFDSSLIHGSGSQIALMMYGQLYYMLHVMLFDLVYHVLVFIPNLITGVFNKFGGGLNDE